MLIINSNDIVVFLTNQQNDIFYLDQLQYLKLNINNNITPIYSQFYKDMQGIGLSHFVVYGAIQFNQIGFNQLKKLFNYTEQHDNKNKLVFKRMTIKNKLQLLTDRKDDIILDEVTFFSNQNTTTVDGTPTQEVYQFYQKNIQFDTTKLGGKIIESVGKLSAGNIMDQEFERKKIQDTLKVSINTVIDGDTLDVSVVKNNNYLYDMISGYLDNDIARVRLQNIDQPEYGTLGENKTGDKYVSVDGETSKQFLIDNLGRFTDFYMFNYSNVIDVSYDRLVMDIYGYDGLGNMSLQAMMIENGYADISYWNKQSYLDIEFMYKLGQLKSDQIKYRRGLYQRIYDQPVEVSTLSNYKGLNIPVKYDKIDSGSSIYNDYYMFNIQPGFKIAIPKQIALRFKTEYDELVKGIQTHNIIFGEIMYNNEYYYVILNNINQLL